MSEVKTLKIDGKDVSGRGDQTILDVARDHGIEIPTLCNLSGLMPTGACRMCVVELKSTPKLLPSCVTRVEEGMEVTTNSERLLKYRKMILEFMFSERNHVCSVCVSNGGCELQSLAMNLGMDHLHIPYLYPRLPVDASHSKFVLDHNRCILCARCVRVCDSIEGAHTKDIMGRGIKARIINDLSEAWGDSDSCTSCGKCVNVCPTGALSEKGMSAGEMRKRKQFLPYLTLMRRNENE
ncbi:MAG: bidirectional hydrogenase complex protein HoxU [bacterium]